MGARASGPMDSATPVLLAAPYRKVYLWVTLNTSRRWTVVLSKNDSTSRICFAAEEKPTHATVTQAALLYIDKMIDLSWLELSPRASVVRKIQASMYEFQNLLIGSDSSFTKMHNEMRIKLY